MRFPDDVPVLSDGEVTLRAHHEDDVPRVVAQCRDPEFIRWTTVPVPYATADAREFVGSIVPQGWADETTFGFAIEYAGQFAGSINLRIRGGGEAEIGFGLHPDARGQQVMTRAVGLLLDWGFERGLEVVHWRAVVGNWGSRRTVWRLGFTFGPTIPRLLPDRGQRRDAWTAWIGRDDPRAPAQPWLSPSVLETDTVRLRPWRESDADRLAGIGADPELRAWMPDSPLPSSVDAVPDYLRRLWEGEADNIRLAWCVADAATDRALGGIALFDFEDQADDLTAQVGYWSHPDARGRGVMTTALRALSAWATRPVGEGGMGVRRLYLLTSVENTASLRLAERAGFTRVGTERASAPAAEGGFGDSALFDLLRGEV